MPLSRLPCNIIVGCTLLLLVACGASGPDPALLPASLEPAPTQAQAEWGEGVPLGPEGPAALGPLGGFQESGFSSEEAEDPKAQQSQYFWDEGGEVNGTNLDPDVTGDSPGGFQPSSLPPSLPGKMPSALNSSATQSALGESLEPDLWEIQGETSGSRAEPTYDPPATDTVPLTRPTPTGSDTAPLTRPTPTGSDTDAGPVLRWDSADAQGTVPPSEAEGGLTRAEVSVQLTTVGDLAGLSPTDETEGVDTLWLGGAGLSPTDETEGVDTLWLGGAGLSPTDETEGVDAVRLGAGLSPTDEMEGLDAVRLGAGLSPTDETEGVDTLWLGGAGLSPTDETEGVDAVRLGGAGLSPTQETEGVDAVQLGGRLSPTDEMEGLDAVRLGGAGLSPTQETEGVDVSSILQQEGGWYSPTDQMEGVDVGQQGGAGAEPHGSVHHTPLTTVPSASPSSSSFPRSGASTDAPSTAPQGRAPTLGHGGTHFNSDTDFLDKHPAHDPLQVICVDWSDLTGKGYVILNMSDNLDCDEFRVESGDQLLDLLETAFSRKMNSPRGSWQVSLSKPTRQDRQLLLTVASEQGVIATKEVLSMLGEIRRGLHDIGIQNYTSVSSCQSQPSQTRSDYGKLFVVLVIIGSVCVVIIASGLIYICWQRRLPKMKNMSRGEELRFMENGCHDNPTLDVASNGQSEMAEKKHSANGVAAGAGGGGGWHVLVNKPGKEEPEALEEDTHL
ncbi:uncharacterized protein podxl2 [Conger conger]|uniref:uncharacterized protein podxl2 n=1 Tax=Conger conger TaxID=82655 RepID=UPI002A5AE85B|nr:uncharacterized protein podxl2 [Conger conger]